MRPVATLLLVHHTPSPAMHSMLLAVRDGAHADGIVGVEVASRAALAATAADVLAADGYLLGTPANLGTMSGALKHFFDTIYYPCLEDTRRRPYALYVHGNEDVDGAVRDVGKIVTGLDWQEAQAPVRVTGTPSRDDLDACWELGAAVAAGLMP
jgi:multimeric flavodoxin WrbA